MSDSSRDTPAVVFAGTMMDDPLLLTSIIERAEKLFGDQKLTSYANGQASRISYRDLLRRVRRLASALSKMGVGVGDRVTTFGWNCQEHVELYLALPAMGAVIHPLNIRLHRDELDFIIRDAGDTVLIADASLVDKLPELDEGITTVAFGGAAHGYLDYEELLASGDEDFVYPRIPELSACTMCYTSGTTGMPKGIVYTHRSTVLHTLMESLPDYYGFSDTDVIVPFVPMFHANGWGLPYAAMMAGSALVLPGSATDAASMVDIMSEQGVTFAAGVPTIWHAVGQLPELPDLSTLRMVVAGGAPLSEAFLRRCDELGIPVVQGFGMTEANPLVGIGRVPAGRDYDETDRMRVRQSQGRPMPLIEVRRDDANSGELQMRGPTIASGYYGAGATSADKFTDDGWLRTGDVAEIDESGIIRIVDRTKDMIKSGGEWIPSVELENAIAGHPAVAEVVVVAVESDRWGERPHAFVVTAAGARTSADELTAFLEHKVARWWIPDVFHFTESIPRTSVGKLDKKLVRQMSTAQNSSHEAVGQTRGTNT